MQSITIFGDIHANLPALEAVLANIEARDLSPLYCLGDLVGYGTFPNEVIDMIRTRNIPTLMGNYDQGVGNSSDDCGCAYTSKIAEELGKRSIAWSNQNTTEENKLYLLTGGARTVLKYLIGITPLQIIHESEPEQLSLLFKTKPSF